MPSINDALDQQYSLFITCTPEIKVTHCKYTSIYAQPKLSFKYTKFFCGYAKKSLRPLRDARHRTVSSQRCCVLQSSVRQRSARAALPAAGCGVKLKAEASEPVSIQVNRIEGTS